MTECFTFVRTKVTKSRTSIPLGHLSFFGSTSCSCSFRGKLIPHAAPAVPFPYVLPLCVIGAERRQHFCNNVFYLHH